MSKVIIIGCGTAGLSAIRGLAPFREIELIALASSPAEVGCVSRHVSQVCFCPHPGKEESAFIDFLLSHGEQWRGALLIESGDYMAVAVSKHKTRLQQYYRTSIADWPVLTRLIEKDDLYQLAEECGVPYPKSVHPASMPQLEEVLGRITFPCILKPVNGHIFFDRYHVKNFAVTDRAALIRRFQQCLTDQMDVLVQEVIPGPDSCLERLETYINSEGKYSALFFINKLRQHPPGFGVMRVGFSVAENQEAQILSERMLAHINYRGYASIEFKRDPRDGRLKLMEINVRMPRPGMLAIAAGVNFPWIIYNDLIKGQQLYVKEYLVGFYWIEIIPDMLNNIFNPYGEKRFSLREYLRPYLSGHKVDAVFDWRDPRPFLRQIRKGLAVFLPAVFSFRKR